MKQGTFVPPRPLPRPLLRTLGPLFQPVAEAALQNAEKFWKGRTGEIGAPVAPLAAPAEGPTVVLSQADAAQGWTYQRLSENRLSSGVPERQEARALVPPRERKLENWYCFPFARRARGRCLWAGGIGLWDRGSRGIFRRIKGPPGLVLSPRVDFRGVIARGQVENILLNLIERGSRCGLNKLGKSGPIVDRVETPGQVRGIRGNYGFNFESVPAVYL